MMSSAALKEAILTDDQRNEPYRLDGTLWRGDKTPSTGVFRIRVPFSPLLWYKMRRFPGMTPQA
ncbi:hypothetical protein SAMN05216504_5194 [Pseudomonas sp. A214]|jgi:hypothetical protein|nr:hypothetical protein SAMN05216504_5194 [Pseudomonas sp. A214]